MKRVDINNIRRLWDKGYNLRKIVKETHFSIGSVKNALVEYEPFIKQRQSRYEKANKNKSYKWISVNQYSLKGEYIATYLSMTEAEKITGTDKSTIMRVCKGQQKYANGFLWKYADDTSEIVPQKTKEIGIIQYDLNHKEVARYKSIAEASKPPFNKSMIRIVANEKNRIYKGFYWEKSESEVLI